MPSENVKALLAYVGIQTPAYHEGAEGAAPLPQLQDKYGGRVHLLARTVYLAMEDVPFDVQLLWKKSQVGQRAMLTRMGTTSRDGEIVRCASAYEMRGSIAKLTVIVAQRTAWMPEAADRALSWFFDELPASDSFIDLRTVARVDVEDDQLEATYDAVTVVSDTYTVAVHCVDPRSIESRGAVLVEAGKAYGPLLNYAVLVDRRKEFRPYHPAGKNNFLVFVPYFSEPCQDFVTADLAPNVSRHDIPAVQAWVRSMAQRRCSDAWPYRQEVHELVEHFREFLTGMELQEELQAALNEVDVQAALLADARETASQLDSVLSVSMQEKEDLKKQLKTAEARLAAAEEERKEAEQTAVQHMLRAQDLFNQLDGLKKEQTAAQEYAVRLKTIADGVRADAAALKQESDGLRRALRASEERARDVVALMRQEDPTAPLRAPGSWNELYGCAAQLKNIRMTASAVEPALKKLVHHVQSDNWLARTWTALVALNEYAAEDHERYPNFLLFSRKNPRGTLTEAHVRRNEGQTVRGDSRMQAERVFSTEAGQLFMTEHIRIGSGDPPAPRLYFLDDPEERVVYVGYIGPHLTNTQTN